MPKIEIDYSNTIFYKIYCRDPSINDLYIGHTTNFVQRKHAHKQSCLNTKSSNYNCKLYDVIRRNKGWDNWTMEIIAFHECDDLMSAKKYEQTYFEKYKATLNSIEPLPKSKPKIIKVAVEKKKPDVLYCDVCNIYHSSVKRQDIHNKTTKHLKKMSCDQQMLTNSSKNSKKLLEFSCNLCDFICSNKQDYTRHLSTRKHKMTPKNAKKYDCDKCHFVCSKESEWNRHIITRKHTNRTILNVFEQKNAKKRQTMFTCECGKEYTARNSLWYHKKSCSITLGEGMTNILVNTSTCIDKNEMTQKMIELVMSKNHEFITELVSNITNSNKNVMEKMMEIMPNIGNNSHNHTNSHNIQNFNIQMFLNDHCKNAMNLSDFIESLPITADTYDSTIENGLTKTLTNMITNGLSQLDILERPIHCTDATRKTLYVKEANNWEKDTELIQMLLGIKTIARKQRTMINKWQDANEGWEKEDNIQTKMTSLICNSMTDIENDEKETSKIIRVISKKVYLDNEAKQLYLN